MDTNEQFRFSLKILEGDPQFPIFIKQVNFLFTFLYELLFVAVIFMSVRSQHLLTLVCKQLEVGAKKTTVVLQKLQPDTPYSVTVSAVYPSGVKKDISGEGKTSKMTPKIQFIPCCSQDSL